MASFYFGRVPLWGILFCVGIFPALADRLEDHANLKRREWKKAVHPHLSAGLHRWVHLVEEGRLKQVRTHHREWVSPDGRATVVVELDKGIHSSQVNLSGLEWIGGRVLKRSPSYMLWEVPLNKVRQLPVIPGVNHIRPPYPKRPFSEGLGDSVAASVELSYAGDFHLGGIKGSGVKVAVMDFGFTGLAAAQSAGELPASLVTRDFTGEGMDGNSDHGVLVAEVLMDMAPEAGLHLLRIESLVDFENAVDYMAAEGIAIANLSGGWFNASYYDGTGPFSQLVNEARNDHGIFFVVSGGNDAERHWRGGWTDQDGNDVLEFASGDEQLDFEGSEVVHVNWNQYDAAVTDLDVYVYTASGELAGVGNFNQTGNPNESFETVVFQRDPGDEPYSLSIERRSGPTDGLDVTVLLQGGEILDHPVAAYSMTDPAVAAGAFTVAAARASTWWLEEPVLETFSSMGPTNDGRLKPDLTGPDGITAWTRSPIFGTSYTSPAVAGGAALLLQETPALTADQLADALRSSARDVGPSGQDSMWGYGLLALDPLTLDRAPVLLPAGSYTVAEADTLKISLVAWDADGDAIVYGDSGLPAGAVLTDSGNGVAEFSWTPDYDQAGDYSIKVSVTANGKTVSEILAVRVTSGNDAPRLDSLWPAGAVSLNEGDSLRFELFASDPDSGDVVAFSWVWKGEEVGDISSYTLRPGYSDEGKDTLYVRLHDGLDTTFHSWQVTVLNATVPPVLLTPNGSVLAPDSSLVWNVARDPDLGDSVEYGIELSPDTSFNTFYRQSGGPDTVIGLETMEGVIPDSSAVYWRVWAYNDSGYVTNYSPVNFFTFMLPPVVSTDLSVVKNFAGANYPNPVGNYTLFPIHVNNYFGYQEVIIRIFDIQGRLVAVPLRRMFPPGVHLYKWEPNTPSGFYLYFVEIGGQVLGQGTLSVKNP